MFMCATMPAYAIGYASTLFALILCQMSDGLDQVLCDPDPSRDGLEYCGVLALGVCVSLRSRAHSRHV